MDTDNTTELYAFIREDDDAMHQSEPTHPHQPKGTAAMCGLYVILFAVLVLVVAACFIGTTGGFVAGLHAP